MNILLLEDDKAIGMGLKYSLENENYETDWALTVADAYSLIESKEYSLYLLDLTLPDGSGYDVCRRIKEKGDYPIIILTAFDDEVNVVMGLEMGADDYISKPFRLRELLARMKTVLRRYNRDSSSGVTKLGNILVNTAEAKVYRDGKDVELTAMEYRLLLILINNRGIVMSRAKLLEYMWDISGDFVNDNTLTVYIKRLRNKIEEDPSDPVIVKTVRGLGYILSNE